jgi:homogentisate 1,2-dioxygenase
MEIQRQSLEAGLLNKFAINTSGQQRGGQNQMEPGTTFASLKHWQKGAVRPISANPKHYVFSNIFEVASKSKPYEKVAVAQNVKYTLEAVRAEGTSPWFAADHDEAAIVMDGTVEVHLVKPDQEQVPSGKEGAIKLAAEPKGKKMGWLKLKRGHMALLPRGSAYQFRNVGDPGVMLVQSIKGETTIERWKEICQLA